MRNYRRASKHKSYGNIIGTEKLQEKGLVDRKKKIKQIFIVYFIS